MKPKKLIIILLIMLILTGCVNINDASYSDIINEAIGSKTDVYNTYRKGYKFYLPKGIYIYEKNDYNEYLKGIGENYYLYVDILGYLNKREFTYTENNTSFYSKVFEHDSKQGYIEINSINSKYLVEIVYNYAKIEVMVDEDNLRSSIANAIIVLSSIKYNDTILDGEKSTVLNYNAEEIDIFKTNGKEKSNFLEYVEYDEYDDGNIPDYDVIQ